MFFAIPDPQYVLSMFLNLGHFSTSVCVTTSCNYEKCCIIFKIAESATSSYAVISAGGGGVLGSISAGLAGLSEPLYPIIVYSVANYRPHLSHFWAGACRWPLRAPTPL